MAPLQPQYFGYITVQLADPLTQLSDPLKGQTRSTFTFICKLNSNNEAGNGPKVQKVKRKGE